MHYYTWKRKSYAAATPHLQMLEDLAYRRLLDLYFEIEGPLDQPSTTALCRRIRMPDCEPQVEAVLAEFFEPRQVGERTVWVNEQADEELGRIYDKSEKARKAGEASARRRAKLGNGRSTDAQRTLNGRSTDGQHKSNHPITQEPIDPVPSTQEPRTPPVAAPQAPPRGECSEEGFRLEGSAGGKTKKGLLGVTDCPPRFPPDLWQQWLAFRRGKRAPLTPKAWKDMCARVERAEGWTIEQAVSLAMERGWTSVRESWLAKEVPAEVADSGDGYRFRNARDQSIHSHDWSDGGGFDDMVDDSQQKP